MKKSGNTFQFSETELRNLLTMATKSKPQDFRGDLETTIAVMLGVDDDALAFDDDIDVLIDKILRNPTAVKDINIRAKKEVERRRSGNGGSYRGCGLGSGGGGCGR